MTGVLSVSVVVPTFNEAAALPSLLADLKPFRDQGCQIVVSDSGSTDGTLDLLDGGIDVVPCGRGRGQALNAGAAHASGDVLLFLHADSQLPHGALQEIQRISKDHRAGCFGIRFPRKQPVLLLCQMLSNLRVSVRGLAYGDQGIFVRRETFEQLGGFRDLPIMEDLDFSMRMRRAGIKPQLARERIVTSDRRFGDTMVQQIRVWRQMVNLRKRFLLGEDAALLAAEYRDAR